MVRACSRAPVWTRAADRVQRVEEEVRLDLQLEGLQPRLRQRPLELGGAHLALALPRVGVAGVDGHDHQRVEQQLQRHLVERGLHERRGEGGGVHHVVGDDQELQGHPPRAVQHADDHGAEEVEEQVPAGGRHHGEPAGQARHAQAHHDPRVPDRDLVERQPEERVVVGQHAELDLDRADDAEDRPERGRRRQDPRPPELHGRQCAARRPPVHHQAAKWSPRAVDRIPRACFP
jgi:hypothetical protein